MTKFYPKKQNLHSDLGDHSTIDELATHSTSSPHEPNTECAQQALACVGPHFIPVKPTAEGFTEHKDQCWVGIKENGLRVSPKCINIRASQGSVMFGHTLCAMLAVSSHLCEN